MLLFSAKGHVYRTPFQVEDFCKSLDMICAAYSRTCFVNLSYPTSRLFLCRFVRMGVSLTSISIACYITSRHTKHVLDIGALSSLTLTFNVHDK